MKTTMKKLAAITFIAIIFIAGSVQAKGTELSALSHESIESSLQIENWMVNESIWETELESTFILEQDFDETLDLENWMTDESTWNKNELITEDQETPLQIEGWMLSENNWK